jgi:micrococcal nuclease
VGRTSASDITSEDHAVEANATVVRVVDGDTLVVDIAGDEESVRLIGLDTPESVAPTRPVECYGTEASERMEKIVPPGTPVRLERDIEARDMYDRLLAYVYRAEDGLHVNADQITQGYAEALPYPPNTAIADELAAAERDARTAQAGLWAACGSADVPVGPPPPSTD